MTQPSILLISDNPFTCNTVRSSLSPKGYSLIEAADARTALSQLEFGLPGLVLQDLGLPDTEQYGLAATMRSRLGVSVPMLAMVGFVSEFDEARMVAAGFNDTITKPIAAGRLLQIVDAHLAEAASENERFGAGKRLLIANDDPLQLKLMRFRLERYGFYVSVAADGADALRQAQQSAPDVIVADIMLRTIDGFALSLAVRRDVSLQQVPVILVTANGIEAADSELARCAGATQLVPYAPELDSLVDALRESVVHPVPAPSVEGQTFRDFERAHEQRVVRMLDRQVLLNTGLARRCSALAAELRVLTGISENVLQHREIDPALDEALAACFDAGGIAMGALYLMQPDAGFRVNTVGTEGRWSSEQVRTFFGHEALLTQIINSRVSTRLPSAAVPGAVAQAVLTASQVSTLLIVPLSYLHRPVGALMMAGTTTANSEDLVAFVEGVGGQIAQVLALASAFSDESRARERAEQQAAVLNALLLHAPDCVAHLDTDGSVLFVSDVMHASQPHITVGESWLAAQRPEDRAVAQQAFDSVISSGAPTSYENAVPSSDGELVWHSHRLGPVRRDGQVIGVMLVSRDISAPKKAEAQLLASDRMASVGMVAASVAHEINNPLAAMMLNLELIGRDLKRVNSVDGAERLYKEVECAREAGQRVIQVVRDLKIFSRSRETITRVRVRPVLESTLRMAWNQIRHRARLETEFMDVPPVDGDESRLGQVFLNLIINAAQAMPEGNAERNALRVATRIDEQGRVLVTVTDTGSGIPEQHRAQLFRPFFTTKPEGIGSGLGLSICDRIVRSMGGSIGFDTEIGKGTTFWVALPPTAGKTLPPVLPPRSVGHATRRGRILVVEDDRMLGEVVERFLAREHDVRMVTSAQEALLFIEAKPCFDVILCDLMMPQMTGQELFSELKRRQPEQAKRVVFMTAGAFTGGAREFLASVRNHRIEKPFDLQVLQQLFVELVQ